jgi:hypothetical protein
MRGGKVEEEKAKGKQKEKPVRHDEDLEEERKEAKS